MTSLVSDFIINPVLRQARRLSSPFATPPETTDPAPQGSRLEHGTAIAEWEEDVNNTPRIPFFRPPDDIPPLGSVSPPLLIPRPRTRGRTAHNDIPPASTAATSPETSHSAATGEMARPILDQGNDASQDAPNPVSETTSHADDRRIPADDGNRALRQRVFSIQSRNITSEEKALLMHQLLTEDYTKAKLAKAQTTAKTAHRDPKAETASGLTIWDHPLGAAVLENLKSWTGTGPTTSIQVTEEDARPTYAPTIESGYLQYGAEEAQDEEVLSAPEDALRCLGCKHYKRNVKLQCATCERWYTCRQCHDEVEDHVLPRRETKHMLCMLCGFPQKASDTCVNCGETAARYYCNICKLWSSNVKRPMYHCDECGICRVGRGLGQDFYHCKTCRACIAVSQQLHHKCIERVTDCNCPICGDYMFSSPRTVIFMQCGHCIHKDCYNELLKTSYKCPICSKSVVQMEAIFRNLDDAIRNQPMPEEFHNMRCIILCNDCSAKTSAEYHFLGVKCQVCSSYNTVQLRRIEMSSFGEGAEDSNEEAQEGHAQPASSSQSRLQVHSPWPQDGVSWNQYAGLAPSRQSSDLNGTVYPDRQSESSPVTGPVALDSEALPGNENEEALGFWGGEPRNGAEDTDEEETEDDDDSDLDEEGDEEDDEDEENDIILIGHR